MQKITKTTRNLAVISLIISAFLGAVMGVWARILALHFENFQQIAARSIVGSLIGLFLYSFKNKVSLSKLIRLSKSDIFYLLIRSLSLLVGIGLFTFAVNKGNFSNINMIYALPSTAILGIVLLKEELTFPKLLAIIIGFLGVLCITVKDFSSLRTIGIGEIAALISTFFYSLGYVVRKFITKALNNQEIAFFGSFITGITALGTSIIMSNKISNFYTIDVSILMVIFAAGICFILLGILNNYGFEHIEAIVANNLLILSSVFGLVIGILFYNESPTIIGLIGGLLVIGSAFLINYSDNKTKFKYKAEM